MAMPSNYHTFANDIKFRSITYIIEEYGTSLIRSKLKLPPPNKSYRYGLVRLNYKIKLYQHLILTRVLTAKYLCYRFLLFVGPVNKTWVFIIKHTVLISRNRLCVTNKTDLKIIP